MVIIINLTMPLNKAEGSRAALCAETVANVAHQKNLTLGLVGPYVSRQALVLSKVIMSLFCMTQ